MPGSRPIAEGLFTDGAQGPRLRTGRCGGCEKPHFPAADVCPYCGADGCTTVELGPEGRLYLFTVVQSRPPGYRGEVPYGFGVVELDGGLRVVTRLAETRLERLRPGLPMRLVLEPLCTDDDGTTVLGWTFRPEAA